MEFEQPLIPATLIKRYKRFLVDVELENGDVITAHTPNTGTMTGCADPGMRVWLSRSDNPKRKYAHTLELIETADGVKVGVHTLRPNRLVEEAIASGAVDLGDWSSIRREVPYGEGNKSRVDLMLEWSSGKLAYLEVKNVTLAKGGDGFFPDAVTTRGSKHLQELMHVVEQGHRAFIVFCVQRSDIQRVRPAVTIDPVYSALLAEALNAGVESLALQFDVSTDGIRFDRQLPIDVH